MDCKKIIDIFNYNVKNKDINTENINHKGREGYWLEKQFGIKHNSNNKPDIEGYEMKKYSNIITLGDFSASEYLFSNKRQFINLYNNWNDNIKINRTEFIKFFGNPNLKKNNRYSWSGKASPNKYNETNDNGQTIVIDDDKNILIIYSFSKDKRCDKENLPEFIKKDNLLIAIWLNEKIKNNINNKYNIKGFFICKKNKNKYNMILFGKPFDYDYFIKKFKEKKIVFDSGMYEGNNRNYSHFRGSQFWQELIIEEV